MSHDASSTLAILVAPDNGRPVVGRPFLILSLPTYHTNTGRTLFNTIQFYFTPQLVCKRPFISCNLLTRPNFIDHRSQLLRGHHRIARRLPYFSGDIANHSFVYTRPRIVSTRIEVPHNAFSTPGQYLRPDTYEVF